MTFCFNRIIVKEQLKEHFLGQAFPFVVDQWKVTGRKIEIIYACDVAIDQKKELIRNRMSVYCKSLFCDSLVALDSFL